MTRFFNIVRLVLSTLPLLSSTVLAFRQAHALNHRQDAARVGSSLNKSSGFRMDMATVPDFDRYQTKQVDPSWKEQIQAITTIASDIDGTLLGADHLVPAPTERVLQRVLHETRQPTGRVAHFFPATARSRRGALDSLGPQLRDTLAQFPGVFLQGLYCVDATGTVIFEKRLTPSAIHKAEALAQRFGATVIGNCGDEIYCNPHGDFGLLQQVHQVWREPVPRMIDSLASSKHEGHEFHKLLFMFGDDGMERRNQMRPELERLAQRNDATVTSSYPTMLELLPAGCSKGLGVQKMCEHLGVDASTQLLAVGDNENDKEMLQVAAIGVAVGNATPLAKQAADIILEETSCQGAAGLAMERFSNLGGLY